MSTEVAVPVPHTGHKTYTGIMDWLTTTDHKKIGIMYIAFAILNAWIGGILAGLIRVQLVNPHSSFLGPVVFNQVMTMHATIMIFLAAMPGLAGFANYLIPLLIGARDMAFPKVNAFSFWLLIPGALVLYASVLVPGGPSAGGWWSYPPLTSSQFMAGAGEDMWLVALIILGISSVLGSINILVTVIDLRAPGMGWLKIPLFVWAWVVTAWMMLLSVPVFTGALAMLFSDRVLGTGFFQPALNGDPLLYQHLFWFFGHPEVYIVVIPIFGTISHIVPAFAGKKVFGYKGMAASIWAIGFLGCLVWAHHMFTAGIDPNQRIFFSVTSMLISVPTGIKIWSWIASMWGGTIRFTTPMKFCLGIIGIFTLGGFGGLMLAQVPFDVQVHNTYFVVGHFHLIFVGATVMGLIASTYYWFPKMCGRMLSEKIGSWVFWLFTIGVLGVFIPQHLLGLLGMARRVAYYRPEFQGLNRLVSFMYLGMLFSAILFTFDVVRTMLRPANATEPDPWGVNDVQESLEWTVSSPPPAYNFEEIPVVK